MKVTAETITNEQLHAMKHAAWHEYKQACLALGLRPLGSGFVPVDGNTARRARVDCAHAWNNFHGAAK